MSGGAPVRKKAIAFILIICMMLAFAGTSYAAPGSPSDPLVTKSWVDAFVEKSFASIQQQINELKSRLGIDIPVNIKLYIGRNIASVNGVNKYIDPDRPAVVPVLKTDSSAGGYTMVPIRFIGESLGLTVDWLPETRQATFTGSGKKVTINVDTNSAVVDGRAEQMAYPAYIENQRTFVHIRFVAEAFDCDVNWDQSEKRVDISR